VTDSRIETLAENYVRNWRAVVDQVQRSLVVLTSVHKRTELVFDTFRNVKLMKISSRYA